MEKKVFQLINRLVSYGLNTRLITSEDSVYTFNRLIEILEIDEIDNEVVLSLTDDNQEQLEEILGGLLDYAYKKGLIEDNSVTYRDLFDVKLMSVFIKRPSEVIKEFYDNYAISPQKATDAYYKLSCDSDYIRRYRIKKDLKWKVSTEYGELDITINLSKPEKDPKAIAALKLQKQSGYPKCLLCKENEGYMGRVNHPARQNHRIIPIQLDNTKWYLQYSPYVYYNEHCIVFSENHSPMVIDRSTFRKLLDFCEKFPHYLVGSNADLPIVGGSILTHEHYQGGNYEFALNRAEMERTFFVNGYNDVECGVVKWPMSVIRLQGTDKNKISSLASQILNKWRNYTDEQAFVFSQTNGEPHNTITPIAYKRNNKFVLDLVLRNNITTDEHPLGVYHPHQNLHHIKKENIGLIEVMGLAVLPARLKKELALIKDAILSNRNCADIPEILTHAEWVTQIQAKYSKLDENNLDQILQKEVGEVFLQVLKDAGVFKRTSQGREAFDRFISVL